MNQPVPFDLAVTGDRAFRFEHGPGTNAYVATDPGGQAQVVTLPDGRLVEQIPLSMLESVFSLQTFRLTEEGPAPIAADSITGLVGEPGDALVQIRVMPPMPQPWPEFPPVMVSDRLLTDASTVIEEAAAAIAGSAPPGWQKLSVACWATARRMEVSATITFAGEQPRPWAPPAMVSQWLHRVRMRTFSSVIGAHPGVSFEFTPDAPAVHRLENPLVEPAWRIEPSYLDKAEHYTDELRLMPRAEHSIPPWLIEGSLKFHQRVRARNVYDVTKAHVETVPRTEVVPLFDGVDAHNRPTWYRPMVGRREQNAILHYLENAPLVLSSRGRTEDELGDNSEPLVPMGFHTDGRWIWSSAAAYYLREHDVPPVLELVDHIRQNRYAIPEVAEITKSRAAALAMGRPWDESIVEQRFDRAMEPVRTTIKDCMTSPRHYSLGTHKDRAWCIVREGDCYAVYWAEGDTRRDRVVFADVNYAAAYLSGRLIFERANLMEAANAEASSRHSEIPAAPATNPSGLPPITDGMREEGRRNPGGWVWCADPELDPRYIEGVPNFALLGAYKVDQAGELTGETYLNNEYRPGPSKRGFPQPHTEFELVLNFIATGWLPHQRILSAALGSLFILDIDSPEKLRMGVDGKGRRFLVVYSSPRYAPRAAAGTMQSEGRTLLPLLAGAILVVNPGAQMSVELSGDDLIATARMPR